MSDIPKQVFTQFIAALDKEAIPKKIVERLESTIVADEDLSEASITAALLPDDKSV